MGRLTISPQQIYNHGFDSADYNLFPENSLSENLNEEQDTVVFEPIKNRYTKDQIIEALRVCLKGVSPMIKPTKTLQNMVFFILKSFFIDGKKYVVANCPTGSGKTIIGFMTYFCTQYLYYKYSNPGKIHGELQARPKDNVTDLDSLCYFLTSNKALQNQIDNDIKRFDFFDYLYMLKGTSNYPCIKATERLDKIKNLAEQDPRLLNNKDLTFFQKVKEDNSNLEFASYKFRPCIGYSGEKLETKFPCSKECPYKIARKTAAFKACTILNYAYFLNVMRTCDREFGQYFRRRELTICDEAHLLPDIVCNMFNFEFTVFLPKRIQKYLNDIKQYNVVYEPTVDVLLSKCIKFFYEPVNKPSDLLKYLENMSELSKMLKEVHKAALEGVSGKSYRDAGFGETINSIQEDLISISEGFDNLETLIIQRPEDVYFESEQSSKQFGINEYKHILKDLKEAELVQNNLLSKIRYGLFMSATLGDVDEYATLMGMHEDEYEGLMLPSTFDFSNSPIYMCESGYLSYNTFDRNIDKVLLDTIKVCGYHPNEKGLIHTSTFKITQLLKEKLNNLAGQVDTSRFLFYQNAKEKEEQIELLRNSNRPYILVGPSMYEGIDLPDDLCRFQVLVKVPYAQISGYIKKKMERYPFWYKRNCIEKVVQAIGRSNRHKNDYSTIYLMDKLFDKIIYDTTDEIEERLEFKKIY